MIAILRTLLVLLTLGAGAARGAPITIDFEEISPGLIAENFVSKGFRFSPECHAHVFDDFGLGTQTLSFDSSGCGSPGISNPNYLGHIDPQADVVYLDRFGLPFSFNGFDVQAGGFAIRSSKGGYLVGTNYVGTVGRNAVYRVSGPLWESVDWIEIVTGCSGAPCAWADNLVLTPVPEPSGAWLAGLGLLFVAYRQRKPTRPTID